MSVAYEHATERLLAAKWERTKHLAKLRRGENDEDWPSEFSRLQAEVRNAVLDRSMMGVTSDIRLPHAFLAKGRSSR